MSAVLLPFHPPSPVHARALCDLPALHDDRRGREASAGEDGSNIEHASLRERGRNVGPRVGVEVERGPQIFESLSITVVLILKLG